MFCITAISLAAYKTHQSGHARHPDFRDVLQSCESGVWERPVQCLIPFFVLSVMYNAERGNKNNSTI